MKERLVDMTREWTRGMLLAAVLLAGTTGSAAVSPAAAAGADAPRLTGNGLPMLDPAFGNDTHFMKALALELYKESPVTA
ncbi:hypothetical protein I8J29_06125 [Paenibacillus sp. MWE-103]|uniref:Uncharacterized protein n=1 Tax=Paenibacillus artemisiicola TaxID=1172618 RepID=A0ABS3W637_9BACL|nr:hypothetical protein [Paenibacillus artemisiicola]MBO7743766.1 hypothetical protein [Paenibacillus artemisiicola]